MAALIIVLVIAGCSKKPSEVVSEANYAPSSFIAYPDTVKVTVKWVRNTEAEAQSGFGGYYVYCTSRSGGLAELQPDSLQYFQVPGCPFTGVDSAVITSDPATNIKLSKGQKYYFYVRTMVDGEVSWAADWARSAPRPEGDAEIYAFVPFDTTAGAKGLYAVLALIRKGTTTSDTSVVDSLFKVPTSSWRDTLIDSTASPVVTAYTPTVGDSVLCGYWADTSLVTRRVIRWNSDSTKKDTVSLKRRSVFTLVAPETLATLVAKKISATQVELWTPDVNTAVPDIKGWNSRGLETLIQTLPGGWGTSVPTEFYSTSQAVTMTVGETGNAYQMKIKDGDYSYYAKIRVDSVTTLGNSIKVNLHYAYQLVSGFDSF